MYLKLLTIVILLLTTGFCHEFCEVAESVANCREGFTFPLDVDNTIKKLVVSSKTLKSLNKDDLKNYTQLEEVDLSNCDIEHIDQEVFINNKNLKLIILSHNKNLQIPSNLPMFISNSVEKLVLEETGIKRLGENVFKEMPNLNTIDVGDNKIEDIEAALMAVDNLETLLIMKNDNLNLEVICQITSLRQVLLKYKDGNNTDKLDKHMCEQDLTVSYDHSLQPTTENVEDTTNIEPEETEKEAEKETEKPVDHSEFCKNTKNLMFGGEIKCSERNYSISCDLSCPEGTKPETNLTNPYTCMFDTGKFVPETVPKCITVDLPKEDEDHKELNKIDSIDNNKNEQEQTTEYKEEKPTNETDTDKSIKIETDIINQDIGTKKNEPIINNDIENEGEKVGESTLDEGSNGSTIVLGIIITIVVVGAIGMAYKYWKNRTHGYHNTNTEDIEEGKEMQTIVNKSTMQPLVDQNNQS